jgi:hypothetical protein
MKEMRPRKRNSACSLGNTIRKFTERIILKYVLELNKYVDIDTIITNYQALMSPKAWIFETAS